MDINYYKQYEPIFGVWRITRLIGEGSFGQVFEMEREDFGQVYKAALKAITIPASQSEVRSVRSEGMDEESVRATFHSKVQELVKEFALMSKLKGNSNVVSYENHQVIEHRDNIGWDILIQMELLTPLDEYIQQKKALPRQEIIKLGIDLCKALELCQKHNIIHRDIKPENTFISENGDFKLGDFGVARTIEKTTGGLSKQGSYPYMAPEIYNGKPYGTTVDIYSLGLILYRLLNGNRLPFLPAAPAAITYEDRENAMAKRFNGAPLPMPSHADGRLGEIVLKACAFEPKDRYSSPVQMRQELEAILYNKEESRYIYPDGDEIRQDSIHSVKPDDVQPIRQEEGTVSDFGSTVSDFGGTVSDFGKTVSDFGGTASNFGNNQGWEGNWMPPDIGSSTGPVQANAARKKGIGKLGVIAACLAVVFLAGIGLLSQGGGEKTNHKPAQGSNQSNTAQVTNYLETITDKDGRVIQEPSFRYDGSVAYMEYGYDKQGNRIQICTYDLLGNLEERVALEFNSEGKLLVSRTYDGNNTLKYYYENTLNENGEVIRSDNYDAKGTRTDYQIYTRDSQGRQSRYESYTSAGDLEAVYVYEYDAQGRTSKTSFLDAKGQLSYYDVIERDSEGNQTGRATYSADGQLQFHCLYDSFDRRTEEQEYNDQGKLTETAKFLYDEKGFLSRKDLYDEDGLLKSYETYTYGQSGKRTAVSRYTADGVLVQEQEYDNAGNQVKVSYYNEAGALDRYTMHEYDSAGNRTKESSYSGDGTLSSVTEYKNSKIAKSSFYDENGTLDYYTIYEYDSAGNQIKKSSYSGDGTPSSVTEYKNSKMVKSSFYDENGTLDNYTMYKYDSAGNQVESRYYNATGALERYTLREYDREGNCVKESDYSGDGKLTEYTVYEFDRAGNCVKESDYSGDGKLTEYTVYEYNEQGQKVKSSYYNGQGELQWYYVYTYGKDGSYEGSTSYNPDGSLR